MDDVWDHKSFPCGGKISKKGFNENKTMVHTLRIGGEGDLQPSRHTIPSNNGGSSEISGQFGTFKADNTLLDWLWGADPCFMNLSLRR